MASTKNPFETLFKQMSAEIIKATKSHYFATVTSVSASGIGISIDGDTSGTKKYTCNARGHFATGDRVLVAKESGTYVVICKVGAPGGPTAKTSAMTQAVGVDSSGALWTAPASGSTYTLPTASSTTLGGVKPTAKTTAMTQAVGVDSSGALWTAPASGSYYTLPTASSTTLGGVKPTAKTTAMTQAVGVDSSGALWTTPASESSSDRITTLYSSTTSATPYTLTLNASGNLVPNTYSQYGTKMGLGSSTYWLGACYLGGYSALHLCNASGSIGFFGATANTKQTLSTTSQNMSYTSATASNYLTILNNLVGILKNKYGLIG